MEILCTKEVLVMCPYNPAHHIRKYRMEGHLVKCRKNYPNTEMAICDFNTTHEVPQPELAYHHEHCSDRKFADLAVYQESEAATSSRIFKRPINFANFPVEDWDDVGQSCQSYDPESYCLNNEILRQVNGQPAAQRRNFRLMERHRFNELKIAQETKIEDPETGVDEKEEYICKMMKKLNTGPINGVIPKFSKYEIIPKDAEDDIKLTDKKNN